MKFVFISSDVSQSDVLVNSFLDGINYKITNQISLQDIPEDATHVTFIYHENYRFPFTIKERYDLFKQLHDVSFNMLSDEEIADLSHVQVFDSSEDIVDSYFVDKQNNRIQPHQFYSYITDFPFFHYEYIESASLYSELDLYNCDISSDYFNDMMYFFNELQKRNKHIVIDFLTCNFVASTIQDIESHFPNLVMRVSTNDTGNPEYGGDWIMEYTSDETETAYVKDIYFNENISHFSIVLEYNYDTYNRTNETDYYIGDDNANYEIKIRVRESDGYLLRVWSLKGSYEGRARSNTTIFIPSAVKVMNHYSRFSTYAYVTETDGIKILKFNPRNDVYLNIHSSTFYQHPSIEEIHIDQAKIILTGGHIFRNMPELKKLVLTGSSITTISQYTAAHCDKLSEVELGSNIKQINRYAFYNNELLYTINLDNVEVIRERVFNYCSNLQNIGSLSNVIEIGERAFEQCNSITTDLDLSNVTSIGRSAFNMCYDIENISLPNGENVSLNIGPYAFARTKISEITLNGSITTTTVNSGQMDFFKNCNFLTKMTWNLTSFAYDTDTTTNVPNGFDVKNISEPRRLQLEEFVIGSSSSLTTFDLSKNFPNSIDSLRYITIQNNANVDNIIVSPKVKGSLITLNNNDKILTIGTSVSTSSIFSNSEIITFENYNATDIVESAFYDASNLTGNIDLKNFINIGRSAFRNCTSLTGITLPTGPGVTIKLWAFINTGITSIDIPNGIDFSDNGYDGQFSNCSNLTSFTYGDQYENVYESMFSGCTSLSNIDLSGTTVKIIKRGAFANCGDISNVYMPSTLERLEGRAFAINSIHTFVFPPGFDHTVTLYKLNQWYGNKGIWYHAFIDTTITNLYYDSSFGTIPSDSYLNSGTVVNAIGYEVSGNNVILSQYSTLTEINGKTVQFSESVLSSFNYIIRSNGDKVHFNTDTTITSSTFTDIQSGDTIVLNVATSITNDAFVNFNYIIKSNGNYTQLNTFTTITSTTFTDIQSGDTLVLNVATSITNDAFSTSTEVDILNTILSSFNYIIKSNGNYTQLNTETTITSSTFTDIQSGDTLVLNVATTIVDEAFGSSSTSSSFANYDNLSVQFSSSLQTIGNRSFQNRRGLTNLDFSNCTSLESIGEDAFNNCSNLTNVDFSGCTSLTTINGRAFQNCDISSINLENTSVNFISYWAFRENPISSLIFSPTLIKLKEVVFTIPSSGLSELFLPPDLSFNNNNTSASSYVHGRLFEGSSGSITNLYYNSANGSIDSTENNWPSSDDPISITNAIGYTIDGSNLLLSTDSYAESSGRTIWGYTISESTNITLTDSRTTYTIGLSNVTSATTFTFTRSDTSNNLIKVAFTGTTSTDISYTNAVTSETQTISSSNIKTKYFNSDLAMTLHSGRTDTITIQYISKSHFDGNIGGTYDNLEAYDIESTKLTISNPISDITFIDSSVSTIDFNNKDVTGLRFSGSFTISDVTNANTTTINSLYHKYSIVNYKLYDKLYFTLQNVSINRDFSDNYGSEHSFDITSKKYYINGLETPQLQLQSGKIYDCSFTDGSFGIFEDISNTTDPSGINNNIFGGTGSSSSSDFVIISNTIDTTGISVGNNYYYGHLTTHGVGGLNNNISIVETITGNWIQSKNTEHSNIITCYKVRTYSDIFHHIYNNDGTGRIMQNQNITSGNNGYINGYYNPKMYIKPNIDIILELVNFIYDSSENNIVSGEKISLPWIYIKPYHSDNTFLDIINYKNIVLESYISLHYVKLRFVSTNHYYIQHDSISYINFEVTNTITETISFERFDFDLEAGDITSPISRLDQSLFMNDTKIRSSNVNSLLSELVTLSSNHSPKIRFTIEDQYTDDPLLTYLFYFKKIEYYGGYLKTISTPYFSDLNESISLNPLQTSFPFRAYIGSFVVTLNGKTHSLPIYNTVNEISKSDMDNLIYMISITGGLKTESEINDVLVNKFNVNTLTENSDKSSIIDFFSQQQMNRNLTKLSSTVEKQTKNILGKPRTISTFFNTDEPNDTISGLTTTFKNSGLSSSTYNSMTFGHSITGPTQISIPNGNNRIMLSHDKLFIINHSIRTFVDLNTGLDISFDIFISKRMNTETQNDVDISINYYNEYKYPRREFDVTISGGKFEINYTPNSQYNSDISGTESIQYTGSALDENGNLNCNENEIYIFHQTDSTNLDSNGILNHALTVYPVDPSGDSMKYANVNCIPTLGGPLTKTRIFHCYKPKFFSEQMDTSKYYFGSIREALDVSFGEWWMNDIYDGTNINIIVDVNDYESPTSFRFLKNHIRSIPSSKIKQFITINGTSSTIDDISSITLKYSGNSINISNSSSLYFHFDLSSETINMSSDTTLDIGLFSHVTTNDHHIGFSDISLIYIIENEIVKPIPVNGIGSIVIDGSITNSDISVHEIDYTELYIEDKHTYVFKPSSFYLNSDLSRSFIAVDVSNNQEQILDDNNISITNTNSIKFKKDGVIQGEFGSAFDENGDWTFISNSMGAYINILPTIPIGDSTGNSYENSVLTKSRDAFEVGQSSGYSTITLNNQRLHPMESTNIFNTIDSI